MTGKQNTVMWMGLLLIITRFFTTRQFKDIWDEIVAGGGGASSVGGSIGGAIGGLDPFQFLPQPSSATSQKPRLV